MKWSVAAIAVLALLPASARAGDVCANDQAIRSSLCRADRPLPELRATPAAPRVGRRSG